MAREYLDLAILAEDDKSVVEGIFRIADTLMWYTPIFLGCELAGRFIGLTLFNDVLTNLQNPYTFGLNLLRNQFNIITDIMVLIANLFYDDNFSLVFWIGDLVYQIVVMQPL